MNTFILDQLLTVYVFSSILRQTCQGHFIKGDEAPKCLRFILKNEGDMAMNVKKFNYFIYLTFLLVVSY